jgi:hypothetical protein
VRWTLRYDLAAGRVSARATRANGLGLVISTASGGPLLVTSGSQSFDAPGTGVVQMLNSSTLELLGDIDVSTAVGGRPRSPMALDVGPGAATLDGKTAYLRTGTSDFGLLYPPQPARLLVLDVASRTVKRVVELGGFNVGPIIVIPPS